MTTLIKLALAATLAIFCLNVNAQEGVKRKDSTNISAQEEWYVTSNDGDSQSKSAQITALKERKVSLEALWKETLKMRLTAINKKASTDNLSTEEVERLKKGAATEIALTLENQLAIIDNQIALVERTGSIDPSKPTSIEIGIGQFDENGDRVVGVSIKSGKTKKRTYDKRTYGETVFALGLNNAVSSNASLGDDFSIGKSSFVEWGYAWKTRVLEDSGALQFKYGLSLQINTLSIKNNNTLQVVNDVPTLETFPINLKKAKLRFTNLVVPMHLEFGGYIKVKEEDYLRYRLRNKFRMGIGGYVGVRLGTQQKLKYKDDGARVKSKTRQDFNGDNFVYGLSSYVKVTGDLSLYAKYDLRNAFNTRKLGEVNTVSLGLRLDL